MKKSYKIKEVYYTLQGEGVHCGRPAVFVRFTGCNLWSGREEDRQNAICTFCDTDFVGTDGPNGGKFSTADKLATHIRSFWPDKTSNPFVVMTGGEPLLQLDGPLIESLHKRNCIIAIETNGTIPVPAGIDWICVSPKKGSELIQTKGNELKLVHPQTDVDPSDYASLAFDHFSLQPMDNHDREYNTKLCIDYCMRHPKWTLSLQTHKIIGID